MTKVKVITPANLGKGIRYNNETHQWESPDEFERLDGYEFPEANDTHYTEEYTTRFRHIKTGFIHEAKKVELLPRGEPVDEQLKFEIGGFQDRDRHIRDDNYNHVPGKPYYVSNGNVVGISKHNGKKYHFVVESLNVGQFSNSKEYNEWAKDKFIRSELVQNGGFSNTKPYPKVKDTEIQIPYPKMYYNEITRRFTPTVDGRKIDLGGENADFDIQLHVKATIRNTRTNETHNVDTTATIPHRQRSIGWEDLNRRLGDYNNQVLQSYEITFTQPPKYQSFVFESTAVFTTGLRITG